MPLRMLQLPAELRASSVPTPNPMHLSLNLPAVYSPVAHSPSLPFPEPLSPATGGPLITGLQGQGTLVLLKLWLLYSVPQV